ncbi:Diacylglycerol O-acyltransferase 1C [Glycine max]|nr:Diacylglycerol O-acyltransferase 1C [Glycine max]
MAISDVPAAAGTTATTTSDSDLRQPSLRRRSSAGVLFDAARDSGSDNSLTGKITDDDNIKDHKPNNHAASDDNVGAAANDAGQEHRQPVADFKYAYRPSVPAHRRIKESPLSSDNIFRQSHAGLFNLCIVVLVAVNSRLIIENLMKYGWLIKYGFWFSSKSLRDWPLFILSLAIFPLAAFVVERLAQQKCISEPVVVLLHLIISTVELCYPVLVILRCDSAFVSGVTLMLLTCIVWLKLVSYAHTNYDMRALTVSNEKTSYPRTPSVRKGWVFRQLVKLIIFTGVMGFIIEQYMNPIVQNSTHPLKGNLLYAIERILKLSVPNVYVWLCMLNILAELVRFGDREFYKDWWNAKTVEEPVHKWMVRHIYFPCLRRGIPKGAASLIAFLVSAVFHELCIAVPCHMFKLWAFIGIMFQVPLVLITNYLQNKYRNSMVGNMIFWFIFCILGQPMSVLLYYHDLMNRKGELLWRFYHESNFGSKLTKCQTLTAKEEKIRCRGFKYTKLGGTKYRYLRYFYVTF